MIFTTTISQKGQIVVPKAIRDKLNLVAADVLQITLDKGVIMVKPVIATDEVFGMFETDKPISKAQIKKSYKQHVLEKHSSHDRS